MFEKYNSTNHVGSRFGARTTGASSLHPEGHPPALPPGASGLMAGVWKVRSWLARARQKYRLQIWARNSETMQSIREWALLTDHVALHTFTWHSFHKGRGICGESGGRKHRKERKQEKQACTYPLLTRPNRPTRLSSALCQDRSSLCITGLRGHGKAPPPPPPSRPLSLTGAAQARLPPSRPRPRGCRRSPDPGSSATQSCIWHRVRLHL